MTWEPGTLPPAPPPLPSHDGGGRSGPSPVTVVVSVVAAMLLLAGMAGTSLWWARRAVAPPSWSGPLAQAGLRPSDVDGHPGEAVTLDDQGTTLDRTTLDWCDQVMPSEQDRVARWATSAYDTRGVPEWRTEVTEYKSVAAAELSMHEVRALACPRYAVPDANATNNPLRHWWVSTDVDATLPPAHGLDRFAQSIVQDDADGEQTGSSDFFYLRRGRIVVDLAGPALDVPLMSIDGQNTLAGVEGIIQARLLALPAHDVDAPQTAPLAPTWHPVPTSRSQVTTTTVTAPGIPTNAERSALATSYLTAANRVHVAQDSYDRGMSTLGRHANAAQLFAVTSPYARALAAFCRTVAGLPVHPAMVDDRAAVLTTNTQLERDLEAVRSVAPAELFSWSKQISSDFDMVIGAADGFRADVGLPNS